MEDVISLSSGSEVDSDVEVVGVYSDTENKAEARPFIRRGWVNLAAYTPFVIRSTGQKWTIPQPRKRRRKDPDEPVEVVDLSDNLSDHSGPVLGSEECQGNKRREGISKHKGAHIRSPGSLSHSPPEKGLTEKKAVLKAEESDILESNIGCISDSSLIEQPDDKSTVKSSDIDIPKCPVKSPSIPKFDMPAQKAEVLESSPEQITQESQLYSGITSKPLCEGKEDPQCLMPETKNSVHFSKEVQTSRTRKEERDALKVQEIGVLCTIDKTVRTEKKEEPGSTQLLRDTGLSLSSQSLVDRPHHLPGDLVPDPVRFSDGFGAFRAQHDDTCYSRTQIPFETSLCPSPSDDDTLRVNLSDPVYNPTSATGKQSFKQDKVHPNAPSTSYNNFMPSCPSIEPDKHAPQESSHNYPKPPPLTTSTTSLGPSAEETYCINVSRPNKTPSPTSTVLLAGESPALTMDNTELELAMDSPPMPYMSSIPSDPPLSLRSDEVDEEARSTEAPQADLGAESLMTTAWKNGSDGEDMGGERGGGEDDAVVSREDKCYVCPVQLKKLRPLLSGPVKNLENKEEEDDGLGDPEPLCRQSLSLVYSTMEENYPEGTVQLLSDLLQPRFFPPVDITRHLLRGILLDPQCHDVLCLEAYSLLMRTQMHSHTNIATVPWDWELLTTVMTAEQVHLMCCLLDNCSPERPSILRHCSKKLFCMLVVYTASVGKCSTQCSRYCCSLMNPGFNCTRQMVSCGQAFCGCQCCEQHASWWGWSHRSV
uniref:Uncharacterized protein n=1 Tax=Esox lucius TaxID=8010 RepID=A0A3P9A645_ESOLU